MPLCVGWWTRHRGIVQRVRRSARYLSFLLACVPFLFAYYVLHTFVRRQAPKGNVPFALGFYYCSTAEGAAAQGAEARRAARAAARAVAEGGAASRAAADGSAAKSGAAGGGTRGVGEDGEGGEGGEGGSLVLSGGAVGWCVGPVE